MAGSGGETTPGPGMTINRNEGNLSSPEKSKYPPRRQTRNWFDKEHIPFVGTIINTPTDNAPSKIKPIGEGDSPIIDIPDTIAEPMINDDFQDKYGTKVSLATSHLSLSSLLITGVITSSTQAGLAITKVYSDNVTLLINSSGSNVKILIYMNSLDTPFPAELFSYSGGTFRIEDIVGTSWSGRTITIDLSIDKSTTSTRIGTSNLEFDKDETTFDNIGSTNNKIEKEYNSIDTGNATINNLSIGNNILYNSNGVNYTGQYHKDVKGNKFSGSQPNEESFELFFKNELNKDKGKFELDDFEITKDIVTSNDVNKGGY